MTRRRRWVALTGTPGVGKTTVARRLREAGRVVVDGKRFARRHRAIVGFDEARRSRIVDPRRVGRALREAFDEAPKVRLLESHWAHEVPGMDAVLVLRCRPSVLARRLERRGWGRAKVRENVEAEATDVILQESLARLGRARIAELDVSRLAPSSAARRIEAWLEDPARHRTKFEIGRVDWAEDFLRWF